MKLALGLDVQTNAKGGKFMSIEDSHQGALVCKVDVIGSSTPFHLRCLGRSSMRGARLLPSNGLVSSTMPQPVPPLVVPPPVVVPQPVSSQPEALACALEQPAQ